jgi:D-arabinose 1-dehydrogenase-like Zn-dependent alcohol dehydrogenase
MTTETPPISKLEPSALSLDSVSLWQITRRRLFRRKSSVVGMIILAILILIALTATGQLRPRVAAMLPLTEVARAHTLVESGAVSGRIVLIHAHHPSYPSCGDTP